MNQRIRVLIADDQQSARNGLKALLTLCPEFEVIGLASDGREALQMAEEYRPDVMLIDTQMPVMDGLEATRIVKDNKLSLHMPANLKAKHNFVLVS